MIVTVQLVATLKHQYISYSTQNCLIYLLINAQQSILSTKASKSCWPRCPPNAEPCYSERITYYNYVASPGIIGTNFSLTKKTTNLFQIKSPSHERSAEIHIYDRTLSKLRDYALNTAHCKIVLSPIPIKVEQTHDSGVGDIASSASYYMPRA